MDAPIPGQTPGEAARAAAAVGRRHRYRLALIVAVVMSGVVLSAVVCWLLRQREHQLAEARFNLSASQRAEAIHSALADRLSTVEVLAAFYAGSEVVTRDEFHTFTEPLVAKYHDVDMFGWAPFVPAAQREQHEEDVRGQGFPDYQITEKNAAGEIVRAGQREAYFPIDFVEPLQRNAVLLGWDVGSRPACLEAMRSARQTGGLTASGPVLVAQAGGAPCRVCAFAPAQNQQPPGRTLGHDAKPQAAGFVFGRFRVDAILAEAIGRLDIAGVDTYLFDETAPGDARLYCVHPSRLRGQRQAPSIALPTEGSDFLYHANAFRLANRRWTVCCVPIESYLSVQRTWVPPAALAAGLVVTALLLGCLVLLTGQTARVERLVAERTAELRAISESALDAVVMIDPAGKIVHWNPAAERIFGFRREEIIGRKAHETVVPPEYRERAEKGMQAFARHGGGPVVGGLTELEALRKDGSRFPMDISVSPIRLRGQWWAMAIIRDTTARKRAEETLHKERRLLGELLDLQERDRKLVAYEIHDGLAQWITGALYQFQSAKRLHQSDPQQAEGLMDEGLRVLGDAMTEVRRLIGGLRPMALDEEGVVAAVEYLVSQHAKPGGPQIEFVHDVRFDRLAPPLEGALFRIVQEALSNALHHSQSERIRVELTDRDDRIRVEVRDWGSGFDPQQPAAGRFGLRGIRERARLFGGGATIETAPGQGTRVVVDLPLVENVAPG